MTFTKCLIIVAVHIVYSSQFAEDLHREARQQADCKPIFHHQFDNSAKTPQLKAIHDGGKLKICYRLDQDNSENYSYSCIDTTDFFTFSEPQTMKFAQAAHLDGFIYDNNKIGKSTGLSLRNAYPAYIAISEKNASSSVDDNQSWVESCEQCVQATISDSTEIFKSNDGTFWACFNDNNRLITSTDMRTWIMHTNIDQNVKISNSFPIILPNTPGSKWVLVQDVGNNGFVFYLYYLGTVTHEDGFIPDGPPYNNLSYGVDDVELFFANKGDVVDDFQYLLPTLINTYVEDGYNNSFKPPVILGIPRKVMFKEINGVQRLVQVLPAFDFTKIPATFNYSFQNVNLMDAVFNPIHNIRSTSFFINFAFDLKESKEVAFKVRMSADQTQSTQIGYLIGDIFYVDRTKSGLPPGMPSSSSLNRYQRRFDAREKIIDRTNIMFQIYADGCSLEVFFDQGQVNFNFLIFPLPTSDRLQIYTSRDDTVVRNFQLFTFD